MNKKLFQIKSLFLIVLPLTCACSSSVKNKPVVFERSKDYKVEVTSSGNHLNYKNQLIYRQYFSEDQVQNIESELNRGEVDIYSFSDVVEHGQKMPGIKVRKVGKFAAKNNLLLRTGDILLSVGRVHVENIPRYEVLKTIFKNLKKDGTVTMSVIRSGQYKKFIYILE